MTMICNHGSRIKYNHEIVGVNSRLDSIQAAVLGVKLKSLDSYSAARASSASLYSKILKDVEWIETPVIEDYSDHVFHQYTIKVLNGDRDELKKAFEQLEYPLNDLLSQTFT